MTGGADIEHANRLLAEAGELDNDVEPPRRTRPRSTPNAPAGPRTLPGVVCRPGPRGTDSPVLRELARAAEEIRRSPGWTSPATWDAIREAIPPDAARAEMQRVEAGLPPQFRAVRRE